MAAVDKAEVKRLGKQRMASDWLKPYTEAVLDVDDCLPVDLVAGRNVRLVKGEHRGIRQFSDYILL